MTGATASSDLPGGASIGQVLTLLSPDFPDLTISKIRFLEAEGLVQPRRRESGYRTFSDADIGRLRFVLTAQRDRFWPLKVIKDALDRLDRGLPVPGLDEPAPVPEKPEAAPSAASEPAAASKESLRTRRTVRMSPSELRQATGLDMPTYSALKSFGLLRVDAAGRHGADDADVAREAAALAAYGIEARHLRLFRVAADREIGLAEQIAQPLRRKQARGAAGPEPEDVQADILARTLALHVALVRSGLTQPN
ncbi:MerR family transcriptional regulator [Ornithinimicrobium sp. Arc0846-15]|nr:MerR family transcriptional regulator [Ornithinimicrobium laminariae]